ncbi:MAG: hypothetical protein L0215_27150 [Gemmataceae bacterium]|nr:hypothetical protein [Gemmataceae bacterium]
MQKLPQFFLCALSGLALAASASWLAGVEVDPESNAQCNKWSLPKAVWTLHAADCQIEQLDIELAVVDKRLRDKRALAQAVIERRITLAEAMPQIRELIAQNKYASHARLYYSELGEDEYLAREMIEWVRGELCHDAARERDEIGRLEGELRSLLEAKR